jgi:hypothetical protein
VEKARSLIEAEANLDDVDEGFHGSDRAEGMAPQPDVGRAGSGSRSTLSSSGAAPSGFAPASVSQSGFSPAGARGHAASHPAASHPADEPGREPSGLHPRPTNASESGVFSGAGGPVSGGRLLESLQSALGAASRNEAGLGSLQRAIRDASRAFTASRQAQESLTEELRVMYRGLNDLMSEKAAVERYASLLTQERDAALDAAEDARREAKRDRDFLLREQDRFIQLLLEEHEAELQQLRRSFSSGGVPSVATGPETLESPGAYAFEARRAGDEESASAPRLSGAALARQALANSISSSVSSGPNHAAVNDPLRAIPLPSENVESGGADERAPTYPPAPAVLDLDALAAEVDGNSERPPPIRRIGVADLGIHLKPARVPTQLFDTLVSPVGEIDPNRKG